jgi:acetyltransferase-like isoleucine patch superfamily enzyme
MKFSFYTRIYNFIYRHIFKFLFSKSFLYYGENVMIKSPDIIDGEKYISIQDNVTISTKVWLSAYKTSDNNPNIYIGKGTYIGRFSHIVSINSIKIENNVLIADKVYISDNIHEYKNIDFPIKEQTIKFKNKVLIGENSWIGENVSIIGAQIGKHCIIGSNSVVNKNIPDYCVAVGIPVKIIKRYNEQTEEWHKTDSNGEFI